MIYLNEKKIRRFYFTPVEDLTGDTIEFCVTPTDGGSTTVIGTTTGGAAGVEDSVLVDPSVTPGVYIYELVIDKGGSNPNTLLPDERSGAPLYLTVRDINAV